jgi:integrase
VNSKAGAESYQAVLRQKLLRGESLDTPDKTEQDITFEQFASRWFDQYVVVNNKFSEQYAKRKALDANLIPFFGRMKLKTIHAGHIEMFKSRQVSTGVSNKTINNRLTVLSKCLRCAHEWYGVTMPRIKLLRCAPVQTDYLTITECDTLLSHAGGQMHEMLLLALRTGMRQGEIRGLQWSSVDWQNRSLTVRHSQCDRNRSLVSPKSYRERHIPLDVDVYDVLYRRKQSSGYVFTNANRNNAPFTSHHLIETLQPVCRKAGLRKITWHVLRHTFATQLTLRSVPLTVVRELLGHSSIATTMRYSHVGPSALRSAIEMLNPRNAQMEYFGHQLGTGDTLVTSKGL